MKLSMDKFKKNWMLNCGRICWIAICMVLMAASAHIGYSLAEMQCHIAHLGASASEGVVYLMLIPYGIVIGILALGSFVFFGLHKKSRMPKPDTEKDN